MKSIIISFFLGFTTGLLMYEYYNYKYKKQEEMYIPFDNKLSLK